MKCHDPVRAGEADELGEARILGRAARRVDREMHSRAVVDEPGGALVRGGPERPALGQVERLCESGRLVFVGVAAVDPEELVVAQIGDCRAPVVHGFRRAGAEEACAQHGERVPVASCLKTVVRSMRVFKPVPRAGTLRGREAVRASDGAGAGPGLRRARHPVVVRAPHVLAQSRRERQEGVHAGLLPARAGRVHQLTVMRQPLTARKSRKARRVRELYGVPVEITFRRDVLRLSHRWQLHRLRHAALRKAA
jgi:hypothetical protein